MNCSKSVQELPEMSSDEWENECVADVEGCICWKCEHENTDCFMDCEL